MSFGDHKIGLDQVVKGLLLKENALKEAVNPEKAKAQAGVRVERPIVFAGGVARNACMVHLLEEALQGRILVPENPHMVGALGAALRSCQNDLLPLP